MGILRQRSILAFFLAVLVTFTVSFSNLAAAPKTSTYTPAQIEQIQQKYVPPILKARERITSELEPLIKERNWVYVDMFIHGPLGTLRQDMAYLSRNLLPKDQPESRKIAKEVFTHLEALDKAAQIGDYEAAFNNYREALKDIDAFLQIVPKA